MSASPKDQIVIWPKKHKRRLRPKKSNEINPYPKYSFHSGICYDDRRPCYGIDTRWSMWEITHGRGLPEIRLIDDHDDCWYPKKWRCPTCGR